jgi:hypothetical protein
LFEALPETLLAVRARPLFVMRLAVKPLQIVGETPGIGQRLAGGPVYSVFEIL